MLDDVLRAGAVLAASEVARTRALAAAGHLALDVMADRRTHVRASEMALREVASELAAAESLSDRGMQSQIDRAMTLVDDYPQTLAAWEGGAITRAHVHAIVDVGSPLPADARGEFDLLAVATAEGLSPGRLRSRLAALAERLYPTTLTERHQRGRDARCVRIVPGLDGMSDLVATLPTVLAVGIFDRLSQQAHAVIDARDETSESNSDDRTTAQLRADILADLLLTSAPDADPTRTDDGPGLLGSIRARVHVVVPALTMLAPGRENGDPADSHCRWPGCTVPANRAEVDHTHDYALGGVTDVTNLAHLCQRHHTQKQFTRWSVTQLPGGVLRWTSPTGRTYTDEPLPYSPAVRFVPDDPPPPDPDEPAAPF